MPETATAPARGIPRIDSLEQRLADLEARARGCTRETALGLTIRSCRMPELLGISSSAWNALRARAISPPEIRLSERGAVLFRVEVVQRWLVESERAGRLLETKEFLDRDRQQGGAK